MKMRSAIESVDEEVVAGRPNVIVRIDGSDATQTPLVLNGYLDKSNC